MVHELIFPFLCANVSGAENAPKNSPAARDQLECRFDLGWISILCSLKSGVLNERLLGSM